MTEILIYMCGGLSVAIFVWFLANLYNSFDFSRISAGEEKEYEKAPFLLRFLLPYGHAAGTIAMDLFGTENEYVKNYSRRMSTMIVMTGELAGLDPTVFAGLSIVGAVLGGTCGVLIYAMVTSWPGALILTGTLIGLFLPLIWLADRVKDRQKQIRRGLPYCLDLVTLAVEAGMDFTTALQIVGEKLSVPALAMELRRTLRAIQMGRTRSGALRDLSKRTNIPELSSVTAAIIQADELGANLGPILRIQSSQLRMRRFQRAEKLAMEAPVKILLPLIAFLFPTTLIVIFGPILAAYLSKGFS